MSLKKHVLLTVCLSVLLTGCGASTEKMPVSEEATNTTNAIFENSEQDNQEIQAPVKEDALSFAEIHNVSDPLDAADAWSTSFQSQEPENQITDYDGTIATSKDYKIVYREEQSFDSAKFELGVLNGDKTKWIVPLQEDVNGYYSENGVKQRWSTVYAGDGMFAAKKVDNVYKGTYDVQFFNANTGNCFEVELREEQVDNLFEQDVSWTMNLWFDNGFSVVFDADKHLCSLDKNGNMNPLPIEYVNNTIGRYSEGLFYYDDKFFDINGDTKIDLSSMGEVVIQYADSSMYSTNDCFYVPYFENGKCILIMRGADERIYKLTIDQNGNRVVEPELFEIGEAVLSPEYEYLIGEWYDEWILARLTVTETEITVEPDIFLNEDIFTFKYKIYGDGTLLMRWNDVDYLNFNSEKVLGDYPVPQTLWYFDGDKLYFDGQIYKKFQ